MSIRHVVCALAIMLWTMSPGKRQVFKRAGAVLLQAALFGSLHLRQGTLGIVFAATMAVIYGVVYLGFGRNLWPLVLVHGAWNTVANVGLYRS